MKKTSLRISLLCIICTFILIFDSTAAYADFMSEAEARKSLPIQSNEIENWPEGPAIGAGSALLMDADTGLILYEKNIHDKMFPASTTKLMTSLLAMEKEGADLNDMVHFSSEAVYSVPWDASQMGIDVGNEMTLEECLYGILVASANEVSNAVAEYVSGSIDSFVKLMNERAKELGCTETHFTNPHGYTDENHYTSAYDLALIGREFFKNELLSKMARTITYEWYPTDTQPDEIVVSTKNKIIKGYYNCDGLVGSKTGYTDESRECLITCCEREGVKLICVIMMEEEPYQYEDTINLLNYGYSNFDKIEISEYEKKYTIEDNTFFSSENDIFGNSSPIIFLDKKSTILIPKTTTFDELDTKLVFTPNDEKHFAIIEYSYNNKYLGNGYLNLNEDDSTSFVFNETAFSDTDDGINNRDNFIDKKEEPTFVYVNNIIFWIVFLLVVVIVILIIRKIASNYQFSQRRKSIIEKNTGKIKSVKYKPFEVSKKRGRKNR